MKKNIIMLLSVVLLNSCVNVLYYPARLTPVNSERQKYDNGVCYLYNDKDSISVNIGLDSFNAGAMITKVMIQNRSKKTVRIAPSEFSFTFHDSTGQPRFGSIRAINAEQELSNVKQKLQNLYPPSEPGGFIDGFLNGLLSKNEEERKRMEADDESRYLRDMATYQDNRSSLQQQVYDLEYAYLKTNDLDPQQKVGGKVKFPSPYNFLINGRIHFILPVNGKEFDYWYDFTPVKTVYPDRNRVR